MALIDLQRDVVASCFGPEPSSEQLAALGDPRVWSLYRRMVRSRIRTELKTAFRRSYAALGRESFERLLDGYLQQNPPRTRFFYTLPSDFAQHVLPMLREASPRSAGAGSRDDSVVAYAADLLAYEAAQRAVGDMLDTVPAAPGEFAFDKRPVFAPALQLLALEHAVDKAPGKDGGYERTPTYLCVYRRAEDKKPRLWRLNPVMFALMERFAGTQDSVQDAIKQVAKERGVVLDAAFVDGLCTVLADFIERGVILGSS